MSKSLVSTVLFSSVALVASAQAQDAPQDAVAASEPFSGEVLASGLEFPWEITWGPDDHLWVTERAGKRVTRIDPATGEKQVALTIDEVLVGRQHEGLLGMATHPELGEGSGNDFVYLVYTYDADPAEGEEAVDRRAKLVRSGYDAAAGTLGEPTGLIAGIPATSWRTPGRSFSSATPGADRPRGPAAA